MQNTQLRRRAAEAIVIQTPRKNSLTLSPSANPALSPETRSGLYYFSSMMNIGAATAYAGIWFAKQGLTPDQIGLINSAPIFALLLINLLVGRVADRAKDWRQVIIFGAWTSALLALGLIFAFDFWSILIVWSLANIAQGAIAPVMDAAATRIAERRGTSFGAIRAWGTIGYVLAIFTTGAVLAALGSTFFIPLFVGFCVLRALISLALPQFRAEAPSKPREGSATNLSGMLKPWLLVPILAWGLIQSTNMALMAFQALLWKQQGLSESLIGGLIAFGAIAETAMMFGFPWLKRNFTNRQLLLIAGLFAALRWTCFAFSPAMPWLIPLQMIHAITYAVGFAGIMGFITRWTAEGMAAEAQGFMVVVQQGATMLMIMFFGHLVSLYGPHAYFASAAVAGLGALLVLLSMRFLPPPGTELRA